MSAELFPGHPVSAMPGRGPPLPVPLPRSEGEGTVLKVNAVFRRLGAIAIRRQLNAPRPLRGERGRG
jgi:hypothetical protein